MFEAGARVEKMEVEAWASPRDQVCFPCFVKHLEQLGNKVLEIDEVGRRVKILSVVTHG